jgi:hypothetical protein
VREFFNRLFRQGKAPNNAEGLFKYFRIEAGSEGTEIVADITNAEILAYYSRIANFIQRCLRHHKIEHYLTTFLTLGGQQMEISMIKGGEKGPTRLLEDAKLEIAQLRDHIAGLEGHSVCSGCSENRQKICKFSNCLKEGYDV